MAYAALIVYVLILYIRPQEWVPGMLNFPIMTPIMAVLIFATLLQLSKKEWHFKDAGQNWLVLGFFFAVLMSHISHLYLSAMWYALTDYGKIILLYYLIVINLTTVKQVRGFIIAIVIGCVFMAIHGILQIHAGSGFGGQLPLDVQLEGTKRIQFFGFFTDPNDLALALVVALPFVINGIHRRGASAPGRLIGIVMAGVLCYGVYLTNSRGGWLALGVMLMSYVMLNFRLKKVAVVAGILMLVALMFLAPGRVSSGTMNAKDGSAHGRLISWTDGNRMLKENPIFGVGKGRFSEFSSTGLVAHNSYVHCYSELGLFGYFFWIGLLFASLKDGYVLGKIAPSEADPDRAEIARLSRVLLAALIGYMAAAVFLSRTYTPLLFILLALFAALRGMCERTTGPVPKAFVRRDYKWVLLAELGTIPVFYIWLRCSL